MPKSITDALRGPSRPRAPGSYQPAIIVLLTDGANNTGILPIDAAQQAADRGLRVFTVGFGTEEGGAFSESCPGQFVGTEPGGGFGGGFGGGGVRQRRQLPPRHRRADASSGRGVDRGYLPPGRERDPAAGGLRWLPTNLILRTEAIEISVVFVAIGLLVAALAFLLARLWRPLP